MHNKISLTIIIALALAIGATSLNGCGTQRNKHAANSVNRAIADTILQRVLTLYDVPRFGLLLETYPENPNHEVDYLAEGTVQKHKQDVSFLWPYSGVLSGVVSLYKETGDVQYLDLLENRLLPGLEQYLDTTRVPYSYQSYPVFAGHSDRFYDDNVWLALDFCTLYLSTKDKKYLDKALMLYEFIYSGWDDEQGGGIYWCEQKKRSKNTCSNAPSAVLCARLYEATGDEQYLQMGVKTYTWTKETLRDPDDYVYWDNISLRGGRIAKEKYTYNSGQMIEAGVLLYRISGDEMYLDDAKKTAEGSYKHFLKERDTIDGVQMFYPDMPWFNAIMFRGLKALYETDGNPQYIDTMMSNAQYAWHNTLDENLLFSNTWYATSNNKFKWLLDNGSMIELFSEMASVRR